MPIFSRTAAVLDERQPVVVEGDTYFKSDWMDSDRDPLRSPTVFLVEQQPHVSLRTHFHRNNQFQLFLRGRGAIGRNPLSAVMVHYASAYSAYGPIVAGPEGLAYFTLRAAYETGSLTMKDHGAEMRRGPKKQLHSKVAGVASAVELASSKALRTDALIPLQDDGAAATLFTLPSGATFVVPACEHAAGQFHVVLAGAIIVEGRMIETWQSMFVERCETLPPIRAGDSGAQIVVLHVPELAPEFR